MYCSSKEDSRWILLLDYLEIARQPTILQFTEVTSYCRIPPHPTPVAIFFPLNHPSFLNSRSRAKPLQPGCSTKESDLKDLFLTFAFGSVEHILLRSRFVSSCFCFDVQLVSLAKAFWPGWPQVHGQVKLGLDFCFYTCSCSLFQGRTRENALSTNDVDFGMLEKKLVEDPLPMPMCLPLDFLKSITHDFSEEQELGRGGFGVVYKGILQNGKTIAVKKLYETRLEDNRFFNEVTYLIGAKHKNIVRLLGYCAESRWEAVKADGKYVMAEIRHRLICFEYINNKTLDEYISAEDCGLDWDERFRIIRGICKGLRYLHEKCSIIHLDLKPQNILMDDNMVPKIADFGMSRLFGQQESRIITENCRGTLGYMAPEYLNKGLISTKSDIFSLGVIIVELLTGSRDYPQNSEASFADFVENVPEKWSRRLPKTSEENENTFLKIYIQQINACTVMGLKCVDSDPKKRPAAWDIIEMLAATTEILVFQSGVVAVGNCEKQSPNGQFVPCPWSDEASVLPYKTANVRDLYRIGKKLGRGQCGTTYRCVRKADGAECACKSIPKRKLRWGEDYDNVRREIQIMHHLSDHPDVVRIHGVYEDGLFVHIVMELCAGGNLLDRIVSKPQGHYSERDAAQLVRKIIRVVDGCHSLGVVHGNIKPENLLFDSNHEDAAIKLTDFEFSEFYMPGDKFFRITGSTYYVAPEVLDIQSVGVEGYGPEADIWSVGEPEVFDIASVGVEDYGPEADIWSVGVILYILLSGVPPFWAETEEGISREILQSKLDFESDPWPSISDSAKDVVRRMLTRDPKKRFNAHEVLCHSWIIDDAVAPNRPTDSAVLSRLKHFSAMNTFTKMALKVIAESMFEDEIGDLKELFKKFDTDNSGTITFDELKDGLKRLGAALSENEIQMLMDEADMDSSGTIDCSEFVAATLHTNKLEREENLLCAFSFFDKDGNGYITTAELSQACNELGVDAVHLEDTINEIDQHNGGRIGYDDFVAMMRKAMLENHDEHLALKLWRILETVVSVFLEDLVD